MCFRWLKRLYHCLRGKCAHRNRGYSREISLHHGGFCSGSFSDPHGSASFSCGREGSVTYTRRPSYCPRPSHCPPVPASPAYSISGGYACGREGSVVITGGDCGGASGWGVTVGTVPVYGAGWGGGHGGEDHAGDLGGGSGHGYGYPAPASPPGDALTTGGAGEGEGYYGGGSGYAGGGFSGAEGGGCSQVVQQKCPVVAPGAKSQQCKQKSHWPPSQKK